MSGLTHLDEHGAARMVDVGAKPETQRKAIAEGRIHMSDAALSALWDGTGPKGDALATARIAGIMAAKRTGELIPLCHPLALTSVTVELSCDPSRNSVDIEATCKLTGKTGVEMEALTAVAVAALTVYDMVKAIDRAMRIVHIRLVHKAGGKSGTYTDQ